MDYRIPSEFKDANSVTFKAEFGREAKFYTEIEVRIPGRSEPETCWLQHVPGDKNQPPVQAPGEWTFHIAPTDGESQFDIDVAQEAARVLPGRLLRRITIVRLRPDICLSPVEIVRKGSFRNAKQYHVKFWHWSAKWEWFAALLVGGLAFLAVNEFLVGMVLMFLSLLSLCSKLWHTNVRGTWKSLGTVGIATVLVLFTMSTIAFMEDKPLSNVPVFWSRFIVLRPLTLSPKQPSYPPDLNISPSTIIPPRRYEVSVDTDFVVGKDKFEHITVSSTEHSNFFWFYNTKSRRLIKQFVLHEREAVDYLCQVTLIKKDERFSPGLRFSIRHRDKPRERVRVRVPATESTLTLKASVDLKDCHANFWALISYLKHMQELDVPDESFSLMKKTEHELVEAFSKVEAERRKSIIRLASQGIEFTEQDINEMLQRKRRLADFKNALDALGDKKRKDEPWWQKFFKDNKWIFGYGLNYVILRLEQSQATVGGASIEGTGQKIPDYLASTSGLVRFTVLVEIKTPHARLISGSKPIRSGAWSLGTDLTDALSQIHASVEEWTLRGSSHPVNLDKLDKIYTVKPKGIIVAGTLTEVKDDRTKRETFELFRKSIHGVEIITFDELYERARFIVERQP